MQKPEQDTVVIDGKVIKITKLPPAPIDKNMHFDRWQHDDVRHSPTIDRNTALAYRNWDNGNNVNIAGKNGRVRKKPQAD